MADSKDKDPQPQIIVAQPNLQQVPGPTEGLLQPEEPSNDPNAKPTYIVNGVEMDPDGNPVKGKK